MCGCCKKYKKLSEFNKDSRDKSGFCNVCRVCRIQRQLIFRTKHPESVKRSNVTYKQSKNKRCVGCGVLVLPKEVRCMSCAKKSRE